MKFLNWFRSIRFDRVAVMLALISSTCPRSAYSATTTVTVKVQDENGAALGGVQVAAITFDTAAGKPDGANSQSEATNGAGNAVFTLQTDKAYQFIAIKHGYSPSFRDQAFDPSNAPATFTSAATVTKNLRSGLSGVGKVNLTLTHPGPLPAFVFAGLDRADTHEPVAFMMAQVTASPAAIEIPNVFPAEANQLTIHCFDPTSNKGIGTTIAQAITNGGTVNVALDLSNGDRPNFVAENREAQDNNGGGLPSLQGVLKDGNGNPISNVGQVIVRNGQGQEVNRAPTDANGNYRVFGLSDGTAYTVDALAPGFTASIANNAGNTFPRAAFLNIALAAATGTMPVTVKTSGGTLIPEVHINARSDFKAYAGADANGGNQPHPGGFASKRAATGSTTLTGLSDGNYVVEGFSPFSQQPAMLNNKRVSIRNGALEIYDGTTGVLQADNAVNLVVTLDASSADGAITGTMTFPRTVTDPAVVIVAHEEFSGAFSQDHQPKGGFAVPTGTGSQLTYTLNLPSGTKYFLEIRSTAFALVDNHGDSRADLTSVRTLAKNFTFVDAGTVTATLKKPDGSVFKSVTHPEPGQQFDPNTFAGAFVNCDGISGFAGNQVDSDGKVTLTLPPGEYTCRADGFGPGFVYAQPTKEGIRVKAGEDTAVTMNLVSGIPVQPSATRPTISGLGVPGPDAPTKVLQVIAFKNTEELDIERLRGIGFFEAGRGGHFSFEIGGEMFGKAGQATWKRMFMPKGMYNFYLVLRQFFEPGKAGGGDHEYKTLLSSVKNVIVADNVQKTLDQVQNTLSIKVGFDPLAVGSASVTGTVKGSHIMTPDDIKAMGGDFNKFLSYVPFVIFHKINESTGAKDFAGMAMATPVGLSNADAGRMESGVRDGDTNGLMDQLKTLSLSYKIQFLPAGKYVLTAFTPNYPPFIKTLTLADGAAETANVDFDVDAGTGATIAGKVVEASGLPVPNASVELKKRGLRRVTTTGSDGIFSFVGLAAGRYLITADGTGSGLALKSKKITVGKDDVTTRVAESIVLPVGAGSIAGTVYTARFPFPQAAAGVEIFAYNDTENGLETDGVPAKYKTVTDSNGAYKINNVVVGNTYKVFAVPPEDLFPGKRVRVKSASPSAATPNVTLVDFDLVSRTGGAQGTDAAGAVQIHFRPPPPPATGLQVGIKSLKKVSSISAHFNSGSTFSETGATEIALTSRPGDFYEGTIANPPASGVVRVTLNDGTQNQTTTATFGSTTAAQTQSNADFAIARGEEEGTSADEAGAGLGFVPGSVVLDDSSATAPTITATSQDPAKTSAGSASHGTDGFAGNIAEVTLTDTQISKKVEVVLPCDPDKITDATQLKVKQLLNGTWQDVPVDAKSIVFDPTTGKCTAEIASINNAVAAPSVTGGAPVRSLSPVAKAMGLAAFNGKEFTFNKASSTSQTGTFGVFQSSAAAVTATGTAYTGTEFIGYNFPNPFKLEGKTLALADGGTTATMSTTGTVIKYQLPTGNAGRVIIRIYTVTGELVNAIDEGEKAGGTTYYTAWDGKNFSGDEVASGVYFAMFDVPGINKRKKTIKMAVLR